MYWSSKNLNIHNVKAVNIQGLTVWCCVSSNGTVGLYFFEGIVTDAVYLTILEVSTMPTSAIQK
jgi:hypothetical protein